MRRIKTSAKIPINFFLFLTSTKIVFLFQWQYIYKMLTDLTTGPLGGSLLVEIPISPPNPNSPPSANWVDALCTAIELFILLKNIWAVFLLFVIILSVWNVPYFEIWFIASPTFDTDFTEIFESRYSVLQSFSLASLNLFLKRY